MDCLSVKLQALQACDVLLKLGPYYYYYNFFPSFIWQLQWFIVMYKASLSQTSKEYKNDNLLMQSVQNACQAQFNFDRHDNWQCDGGQVALRTFDACASQPFAVNIGHTVKELPKNEPAVAYFLRCQIGLFLLLHWALHLRSDDKPRYQLSAQFDRISRYSLASIFAGYVHARTHVQSHLLALAHIPTHAHSYSPTLICFHSHFYSHIPAPTLTYIIMSTHTC